MKESEEHCKGSKINSRKSLLIVNDLGISYGGTQKRIFQLIEALLDKQVFEHIFVVAHEAAKEREKLEDKKNVDIMRMTRCYADKDSVEQVVKEIIKQNNIALVQVHNLSMLSTRAIKAAKTCNKKVLFFAHDYWPICGRRSFYTKWKAPCTGTGLIKCLSCIGLPSYINIKTIIKNDLNKCDIGVATADFMIQQYEKNGVLVGKWKKVTPWIEEEYVSKKNCYSKQENNGVKKSEESKGKKKQCIILYVGSLDEEKGFFDLLEIFIELKDKVSATIPVKLIAVGEASRENKIRIEQILKAKNIEKMVELKGYVQEQGQLIEFYKEAALFVFPSRLEESFGQTWAQALASGTPVIAYEAGSVKELLSVYGKTIKRGDKAQLKEAVKVFFTNKDTNKCEQANANQEYAHRMFSIKNAMLRLEEIYTTV